LLLLAVDGPANPSAALARRVESSLAPVLASHAPQPTGASQASSAQPTLHRIDGLSIEELVDGSTILRLRGTSKPTFNVYRLSNPDRLVVDVSGSERGNVVPHAPVDSWAVGRVSVDSILERGARLTRVVIELKREASYIVVPDTEHLVVTVTPRETPPEAYFARKSAGKRKADIERDTRHAARLRDEAGSLKAEASVLNEVATERARVAEREAKQAQLRASEAMRAEQRARAAEHQAKATEAQAQRALAAARSDRQSTKTALEHAAREREKASVERGTAERERRLADEIRTRAEAMLQQARAEAARDRQLAARELSSAKQSHARAREAEAQARTTQAQASASRALAREQLEAARRERYAARAAVARAEAELRAAVDERRNAKQRRSRRLEQRERARRDKAEQAARSAFAQARARMQQAEQRARTAEEAERSARMRTADVVASANARAAQQLSAADRERGSATTIRRQAEQVLAEATDAMRRATAEREQAERMRKDSQTAVAEAKAAMKRGRNTDKQRRAALDRALVQARQAEQRARERQKEAEHKLARLAADRERLERLVSQQRASSAALERSISTKREQLAVLETEVARARARAGATPASVAEAKAETLRVQATATVLSKEIERFRKEAASAHARAREAEARVAELERRKAVGAEMEQAKARAQATSQAAQQTAGELSRRERRMLEVERTLKELDDDVRSLEGRRAALEHEGKGLSTQNAHAKAELDKAERRLVEVKAALESEANKLDKLERDVADAQNKLDAGIAAADKHDALAKQWTRERKAAGPTKVDDVRFEDSPDEERVIVEVTGPIDYQGSSLTPNMKLLRFAGAGIAAQLERSLDASAYDGPIAMISSFREDDDVKIVVSTREQTSPVLEEKPGRLVWRFPRTKSKGRTEAVSMAGTRVGGFATGTSIRPLAVAAPPSEEAPSSTTRPAPGRTKWRGERIDIELQDAPVKDVLLLFSDIGRVNIIAGKGVEGNVTMKLTGVPWDQALDIILRSLNLGMVREGNVIRVATIEELDKERKDAIERANAQVLHKPLETRLVPVSYAAVNEMVPKVQSVLSSRGSVTPDTRTNTLIIMDVGENITLAEQLVRQLDSQTPQVLIEARIVEARTSFLRQLGIQWGFGFVASPGTGNPTGLFFPNSLGVAGGATGTPVDRRGLLLVPGSESPNYAVDLPAPVGTGAGGALGFSFGSLSGNLNTNLRLSAAEDVGEVRIISAPKIVTLDNHEAQIEQGVQIPISQVSAQGVNTRYVNATLGLRVTPHVTNEGAVLMDVTVQKNEADFVNTGARGDPTILTKQAQSRMLVNDGDTAVIGGIYTRNRSRNYKKVPWIADIPIIGWFFKNRTVADTRTEVLIFLTPKIVNRASSIGG